MPTIGIAKNPLAIDGLSVERVRSLIAVPLENDGPRGGLQEGWDWAPGRLAARLVGDSGKCHGLAMRTPATKKPLYISQGHRISLDVAHALVRSCIPSGQRQPLPIIESDRIGRVLVLKEQENINQKVISSGRDQVSSGSRLEKLRSAQRQAREGQAREGQAREGHRRS